MMSEFLCNTIGFFCNKDNQSTEIIDWTDKLDNYNERIRFLVLHHTVTDNAESTLNAFNSNGTSCHYVVDKDGKIYKLVDEEKRAWHAGISQWNGRSNLNDTSIGIEIVNMGNQNFPKLQIDAVSELSKKIINDYKIDFKNIVSHSDIAPGRKFDPSGYFDWELFYKNIGAFEKMYDSHLTPAEQQKVLLDWQITENNIEEKELVNQLQSNLAKYGYKVEKTSDYDVQTRNAVEAFNRHFSPEIFQKEEIIDFKVVQNPENQKWYGISEERLNFLLNQ